MSNINKLDGISAVEDLTDAAAAVVEGGGNVRGRLKFDSSAVTKAFVARRGGSVSLSSVTTGGDTNKSGVFKAVLKNLDTGRTTPLKVPFGNSSKSWKNVRGGLYVIDLVDRQDGIPLTVSYAVIFSS